MEDTGVESETKVDLSVPEKSASTEASVIPESSLSVEPPKDKDKLLSKKIEENADTK